MAERGARESNGRGSRGDCCGRPPIAALVFWILPLGAWWLRAIETRFPPPDPLAGARRRDRRARRRRRSRAGDGAPAASRPATTACRGSSPRPSWRVAIPRRASCSPAGRARSPHRGRTPTRRRRCCSRSASTQARLTLEAARATPRRTPVAALAAAKPAPGRDLAAGHLGVPHAARHRAPSAAPAGASSRFRSISAPIRSSGARPASHAARAASRELAPRHPRDLRPRHLTACSAAT